MAKRKDIMIKGYTKVDREGEFYRNIYNEPFSIKKNHKGVYNISYYGIHFSIDIENKKVTELEIERRADISAKHYSVRDLISLFNDMVWWCKIGVHNGRIVNLTTLRGFKHSEKVTWNRKSKEFKKLYNLATSSIPKSAYKENYRVWINRPLKEFRKFINENKKICRRIEKRRLEALE